jgi:hypothetical protein
MKFAQPAKLDKASFEGQEGEWVDKTIATINGLIDSLVTALGGSLDLVENLGCQIHTFSHTAATATVADFPYDFKLSTKSSKATNIQLATVVDVAPTRTNNGETTIEWEDLKTGNARIRNVTGLTAGKKYSITVIVYP